MVISMASDNQLIPAKIKMKTWKFPHCTDERASLMVYVLAWSLIATGFQLQESVCVRKNLLDNMVFYLTIKDRLKHMKTAKESPFLVQRITFS